MHVTAVRGRGFHCRAYRCLFVSRGSWQFLRSGVPGGCEPAALATESFPRCPPGLLCGPAGVGLEAGEDGVAEAALERAECFFGGLALGELAVVVGAAVAVAVADLGDGGHVDGVVEPP